MSEPGKTETRVDQWMRDAARELVYGVRGWQQRSPNFCVKMSSKFAAVIAKHYEEWLVSHAPAPSERRLPVPIQPGEFEAEDGQRFNPIHAKPATPQGSAAGEIKPHSSVIYTDLKVRCYGCQSQVIWRYDEKIDEILIVHDHARTTPQGSAARPAYWAVEWSFKGKNTWHVVDCPPYRYESEAKLYPRRDGFDYRIVPLFLDAEASERKMQEALTSLRAFFANDPKGEYVLARADGNPLCLADRMVIAGRFIDSIDAALAAPDAPPEDTNAKG